MNQRLRFDQTRTTGKSFEVAVGGSASASGRIDYFDRLAFASPLFTLLSDSEDTIPGLGSRWWLEGSYAIEQLIAWLAAECWPDSAENSE